MIDGAWIAQTIGRARKEVNETIANCHHQNGYIVACVLAVFMMKSWLPSSQHHLSFKLVLMAGASCRAGNRERECWARHVS